jgi:dTDP-4-dehydrorhamnose reductase
MWAEGDACEPVNAYGRSKLEAERAVAACWPRHVILRSSIIYGPLTRDHIDRTLFIQFIVSVTPKH